MTGELLDSSGTTVYRQCVGGLLCYTQDRADAQYEVSILGTMLGRPTQGSMISLKRVTRCLKGTREFVNKLELDKTCGETRWVFGQGLGWFDRP